MLTELEKAKCRFYLGFPDAWRYKNTRLESILTTLSPEAETQIQDNLTVLDKIQLQLQTTVLANAGLKRVDEIWFGEPKAMRTEVQNLGRQYVTALSVILGVPIESDIFGKNGYPGDSFFPGFGKGGRSGGGVIPLG